jgi:hypothetical protein
MEIKLTNPLPPSYLCQSVYSILTKPENAKQEDYK